MDRTLWENPRNTPALHGTTEPPPPPGEKANPVSATFGTMEFGAAIFWLFVNI